MLPTRLPVTFLLLLIGFAVAACDGPSPTRVASSPPAAPPAPTESGSRPASSIPSRSAAPTASAAPTLRPVADEPPPLALDPIATGIAEPIGIVATPDGWLLVNERGGRVVAVDPASGEGQVALDITDRVLGQGEQGLLGLALHPEDPRVFVHYTDPDGDTVLSEFFAADGAGRPRFDPASETQLLTVDQPFANHNGGQLVVGPDGQLWMGLGDGGAGGDPLGNGQDPDTLLGSILRLDVSEAGRYAIPADNAFADGGGAAEVHLYGLRNPWRFSFDRVTGTLWIADVGQNAYEEVNRLDPVADAGANLGWNVMEGLHCFAVTGCPTDGLALPITEYGRDAGCSITGGYVYRGEAIPDLWGWYLFSDYCSGLLFGVPSDAEPPAGGEAIEPRLLLETGARVTSFGQGADGELYLTDLASGTVYRIVAGG